MTAGARRQLELPALAGPPAGPPEPALPAPAAARSCAACGWLVRLDEETCPLCHAPEDPPR